MTKVYGWVKFTDGTELDFCANEGDFEALERNAHKTIKSIGHEDIGDEAGWLFVFPDGEELDLDTVEKAQQFLSALVEGGAGL